MHYSTDGSDIKIVASSTMDLVFDSSLQAIVIKNLTTLYFCGSGSYMLKFCFDKTSCVHLTLKHLQTKFKVPQTVVSEYALVQWI